MWRPVLLVVQWLIAITAIAGGVALVAGPRISLGITPPPENLAGSPFQSYIWPGIILAVVVGGTHVWALILLRRRRRGALVVASTAAFGVLIWVFVQVLIIPFSVLQVTYFALGLIELALVLLMLDVFHDRLGPSRRSRGLGSTTVSD